VGAGRVEVDLHDRRAPPLPLGRRNDLAQLAARIGLAIGRALQVPQLAEDIGELAQELERFIAVWAGAPTGSMAAERHRFSTSSGIGSSTTTGQ